jgi:hypothetical protein
MLSASHRYEQPDVIAARHARDSSSLDGLQKIIAKAREDATQSQDLQRLSPLGAFPKRLAIVSWDLITLVLPKAGRIDRRGSNNTGGASIVFQFQPRYNPEIDHEEKARL